MTVALIPDESEGMSFTVFFQWDFMFELCIIFSKLLNILEGFCKGWHLEWHAILLVAVLDRVSMAIMKQNYQEQVGEETLVRVYLALFDMPS